MTEPRRTLPPSKRPSRWGEPRRLVEEALRQGGAVYTRTASTPQEARQFVKRLHRVTEDMPNVLVRASYDVPDQDGTTTYQVSIGRREA